MMFWPAALWMFVWCAVLVDLSCLPALIAATDQEQRHCSVPAPSDEDTNPCPPWFIPQGGNTTVECRCGPQTNGIICDPKTCNTSLHIEYCMTYDPVTRTQVGGNCLFESKSELITILPANVSELNDFMCGGFNREGQLCGACKKGYGPALLKYDMQCTNCSSKNYGWALYLLLGFLPITVFYLIIVMFQVSATSGPLNVFIFSAQIIAISIDTNKIVLTAHGSQSWSNVILQILETFYAIWNLDFFHSAIPPFCVSENITTLHALALQYLPAFYPLLLIAVTYILIELHDRNFRVLVWMWRPFHKCLAPLRGSLRWNPKASIVNTFATFLTLTYNKLIIVSGELLCEVNVTDIRGNSSHFMLLTPTVPYFSTTHLPFAILAIAVLSTFTALPPLLLVLYPTKTFQKMLNCLKIRWHALHIFADVFQGCYRNRTDGKNDYRYFAAFYFTVRISIFLAAIFSNFRGLGWTICTIILITASLLVALLRPYKKNWLNILDSLILASQGLAALWILYNLKTEGKWINLVGFIAALPMMYFVTYVTCRFLLWSGVFRKCKQKLRNIYHSLQQIWKGHNFRHQDWYDEEQLPDRLVNPLKYQSEAQNREDDEDDVGSERENLPIIGAYTNDYGSTH